MNKKNRILTLIDEINYHCNLYYNLNKPEISDMEFDKLYDELINLEQNTGIIYTNSPTQEVGYKVVSKLNKIKHDTPLLSLNKTKEVEELKKFIKQNECIVSLKADGLTTKLTYDNGMLNQAVTRGDGYNEGEDITHNILTVRNIPNVIPFKNKVVIVGESVIKLNDFEKINSKLDKESKYKNSRNLAAGSVRQLDSNVCKSRNVNTILFNVIEVQGIQFKSKTEQLNWLTDQGFEVIPHILINKNDDVVEAIDKLRIIASELFIPIDGIVLSYNDIKYSESLGFTSKFPRSSLVYKFYDDLTETTYRGLDTQTTRTGIVSLTATFDPVVIDGTEVERASVHNVDIWESLQLGVGDAITAYKANMIIPQIADNLTRSGTEKLPTNCPTCNSQLEIIKPKEARFLSCPNPDCKAKLIGKLEHFVSRECMNIVGLSEQTLEKFIERGYINDFVDIYRLERYAKEIKKMDGFGLKSYNKLIESIENSKNASLPNFINALGISKVGLSGAKLLAKNCDNDIKKVISVTKKDLNKVDGFGEVIINNIVSYFSDESNLELVVQLISYLNFKQVEQTQNNSLDGKVFVITGSIEHFKNRKELQSKIESLGGKVSSAVSAKTDFLLNNDNTSNSSKNKAAKSLGVKIITEDEFLEMIK